MEQRILADLRQSYGIDCQRLTPIAGGWLNRLWRVSYGGQDLLVKHFSGQRYDARKLVDIEAALQRQTLLHAAGIPCPAILPCAGRAIRIMQDGAAYMVMAFSPGAPLQPEQLTLAQMRSLGSACGAMHAAFARLPVAGVKGYPLNHQATIGALDRVCAARGREDFARQPQAYRQAVLTAAAILPQLPAGFLARQPQGIAHEDFTSDNILFDAQGVAAIIDFDRNVYGYVRHDVGRAMLSFAWVEGQLRPDYARAFVQGYAQHLPLTLPDVADALRLAWCIEIPWWVQPDFFQGDRGKATRFRDEILWISDNWFALDDLLHA